MGLWGGRFEGETDPLFRAFNDSLPFDHRLVEWDIRASIAWAGALHEAGVLHADETARLVEALEAIARSIEGSSESIRDAGDEDVHAWVEARLIERVGELGKKLHTGRSRNDQVATDLRLAVREAIDLRRLEIRRVQRSLVALAGRHEAAVIPGYTHLQRAQPVLFAHWCLAYLEMLDRDAGRFEDARRRGNECPLGSGALAGSAYPIDREALARALGFDRPTRNSLDAVSDRDFVLEVLAAATICSLHLSRVAEDLIAYASAEFGFIELDDSVASGSSLMPQKKNPDALELIRGKSGAVFGSLAAFVLTVKALPLAYNKDLQEDKPALFRSMDELSMCLQMLARVLDAVHVREPVARRAACGGYANATALADYLVARGTSFRDAHGIVGRVVRRAIELGKALEELDLEVLRSFSPLFETDVYDAISLERVMDRYASEGGTSPVRVREALEAARARLSREGE